MAARENQGYLIAVISLVVLSLLLALVAFLGWQNANQYYDSKVSFETNLRMSERMSQAQTARADVLAAYIGELGVSSAEGEAQFEHINQLINQAANDSDRQTLVDLQAQLDKYQGEFSKDQERYLGSKDQQNATWRGLVENFSSALSKKYADLQISLNDQKRVVREANAAVEAAKVEKEQINQLLVKTQDDLAKTHEEFDNFKKITEETLNEIQDVNKKLNEEIAANRSTFVNAVAAKDIEIAKLANTNKVLKDQLDIFQKEEFDLPDGKIVRVAEGKVFVNVGAKDGLKTTRTFSIYDSKDNNFERANPKAAIEITKVWDHQAEGRITSENVLNPILADDWIINPVWDPGYSVPIALAGIFDLDHDGFDDRDRLIQMIKQNGGNVVAFHDGEGNVSGEVDAKTRYLVVGDSPALQQDANPNIMKAMRKIEDQGEKYQIQEIDTRKLLNWMGLHSQPIVEALDRNIGDEQRRADAAAARDR